MIGALYPRIIYRGRPFDLVAEGGGVVLPLQDDPTVSLAAGSILHDQLDALWNNLWIVRDGDTMNSLERFTGEIPRPADSTATAAADGSSGSSGGTAALALPPAGETSLSFFEQNINIAGAEIPIWVLLVAGGVLLLVASSGGGRR